MRRLKMRQEACCAPPPRDTRFADARFYLRYACEDACRVDEASAARFRCAMRRERRAMRDAPRHMRHVRHAAQQMQRELSAAISILPRLFYDMSIFFFFAAICLCLPLPQREQMRKYFECKDAICGVLTTNENEQRTTNTQQCMKRT